MKRPSFQFYPGDWTSNPNLKRCTFAEKGIWLEVMCLMHDQAEYGVLRWPLKEIAEAVKCRSADLQALIRKGVLKGDDKQLAEAFIYTPRSGRKDGEPVTLVSTQAGPIWYSSRMVKDEHLRTIRGGNAGSGEGIDTPPKPPPKPAPKGGLGEDIGGGIGGGIGPCGAGTSAAPSSSSSSSSSESFALSAREPTPAGEVGQALKRAGVNMATVQLGDPMFKALLAQGATPDEFESLAAEAIGKGIDNPWKWVLKVLPERRAKAQVVKLVPKDDEDRSEKFRGGL